MAYTKPGHYKLTGDETLSWAARIKQPTGIGGAMEPVDMSDPANTVEAHIDAPDGTRLTQWTVTVRGDQTGDDKGWVDFTLPDAAAELLLASGHRKVLYDARVSLGSGAFVARIRKGRTIIIERAVTNETDVVV